jgi:hypothetical protein
LNPKVQTQNNPIVNSLTVANRETILTKIKNNSITYQPLSVDAIGNWLIETGDYVNVVSLDSDTFWYRTPVFSRVLTWNGACHDHYECTGNGVRQEYTEYETQEVYNDGRYITKSEYRKPITITIDPVENANGAYTHTTSDDRISEDMKAVAIEVGTPETFLAPIEITTGTHEVTLECANAVGSSTVVLTFIKTQPLDVGEITPTVTSAEFDILAGRIGSLSSLTTTDKDSVVEAINEVNDNVANIGNQTVIDWTADSSNATGVQLTTKATLNKGTYIAVGSTPLTSITMLYSLSSSVALNAVLPKYTNAGTQSLLVFTFKVVTDGTQVWLSTASSSACNYTYKDRGGLWIVRISA